MVYFQRLPLMLPTFRAPSSAATRLACSFGGISTILVLGTEAASVAATRAPPSAAPWLPLMTPASTSPPSKAPRGCLRCMAPTTRAPFHAAPTLPLNLGVSLGYEYQPGSSAVRLYTVVASGGTTPCITSFQGIEATCSDTLWLLLAAPVCRAFAIPALRQAASGVVTGIACNPSLYGTKMASYHGGALCKTLSRPPQHAQEPEQASRPCCPASDAAAPPCHAECHLVRPLLQ